MSAELRPCPFCGGKAHIVEICTGSRITDYSVSCDDIRGCIAGVPMQYYKTEDKAASAWNRRACACREATAPADAPTLQPLLQMGC